MRVEEHQCYVLKLEDKLEEIREIAKKAHKKGFDPSLDVEFKVAKDLADLVEGLVGPPGVANELRELLKLLPKEEASLKIAEEIIIGKYGRLNAREAAEQAIRTALAILTEGITAAPLQGIVKVDVKRNFDRTEYLAIYFAGPIRSAGGTEQALTLVVGDFVRRLLKLDRYKPTEEEIARFVEEVRLYERSIGRFQYRASDEQLKEALRRIPIEVTGIGTDPVEVSFHRDLQRIETNRVRGGALRVVNDGVVGRALKVWAVVERLGIDGWDWLKRLGGAEERRSAGFMDEVIAGRPVFAFPSRPGGFRLRYGRARNTGLAAVGIHPATMSVLGDFIAIGTQLRLELPGKGGIALPVDSIEPPIVRLKDGSVVRVTLDNVGQVKGLIDKVLFLGDILISFGDFLYNNKPLAPPGYAEEWYVEELRSTVLKEFNGDLRKVADIVGVSFERLRELLRDPFEGKPNAAEAVALATKLRIPLHPRFTFFWNYVSIEELKALRSWAFNAKVIEEGGLLKVVGELDKSVKVALEKACVPHKALDGRMVVEGDDAFALAFCLGRHVPNVEVPQAGSALEAIERLAGVKVREKASTSIGARMGRPEKAKRREMKPLVHVLFPIGLAGGPRRDLIQAGEKREVWVELVKRRCPRCKRTTTYVKCFACDVETLLERVCSICGRPLNEATCPACNASAKSYERRAIDVKRLVEEACAKLSVALPPTLKGVKGLTSEIKAPEPVEKGLLRAKYDLSVYKDGTTRFDATNAPLTHFKPLEIGVSVERLKELGYDHDIDGNPLATLDQICELKVQDVIIPLKCAEYFMRVTSFLDDLLERLYGLPRYYNVKRIEDLVGHIMIGLAPHTSVGVLGRIVGFTPSSVCYAHPIWHSAKRRDCDGDEDALMLALDVAINFSRSYLPAQIGGIMDAPLFIIAVVNPREVQRQAHDVDVSSSYPLAFYEKALEGLEPKEVQELIDLIKHKINDPILQGLKYTMPTSNINIGNNESAYKRLKRMADKLNGQLELAEKVRAVSAKLVAKKVLVTHFLRDIVGNLRAFSTQIFRCKSCGKRFRRVPLKGFCTECEGELTLTVHRSGIKKYLELAERLVKRYELSRHYAQRIEMIKSEVNSLFEGSMKRQVSLADFA